MGRKVHPYGFRVGITRDWQSKWFSERDYTELLHEDLRMRHLVMDELADAGISQVLIDRNANQLTLTVKTAKPGIVIGRGGANADRLRAILQAAAPDKRVRLNIEEIAVPELDAYLVARSVADQLERRVAFRRAMKQGVQRTMQRGALGCRVRVGGRLGGTEMSRAEHEMQGRVPLHTIRADIDYGLAEAKTTFGVIGVKCWIYRGDIAADETPFALAAAEITES
ncbi:MAG TPA: 30S ribosomal protein S3 [Dehalococcoidia bacterium]|nr:30S ribosomal protein S3 [Dehalococcoidia bacterium]